MASVNGWWKMLTVRLSDWCNFALQEMTDTSKNQPDAQAQTLPDETPQIGKIYPFTKMDVTFEPVQWWDFDVFQDLESSW